MHFASSPWCSPNPPGTHTEQTVNVPASGKAAMCSSAPNALSPETPSPDHSDKTPEKHHPLETGEPSD